MVKKIINYAGQKCYLWEEVSSSDSAQYILDSFRDTGLKACALHERGKHQIYVEPPMKYAIYSNNVKEADKYNVTTLPSKIFGTKTEALKYIKKKKLEDVKIMRVNVGKIRNILHEEESRLRSD